MPICINLDPLNWTHPDLIHIEGDGCRHGAGASVPAASQEAAVSSRSPSPRFAEGPPTPARRIAQHVRALLGRVRQLDQADQA